MDNVQQSVDDEDRTLTSRVKTLTPKGYELYQTSVDNHIALLDKAWIDIDIHIQRVNTEGIHLKLKYILELEQKFRKCVDKLQILKSNFFEFLDRKNTEESLQLLNSQVLKWESYTTLIEHSLNELHTYRERAREQDKSQEPAESVAHSRKSGSSSSSKRSNLSSVIARKKAKAEAEKTRLLFAEKEMALKKKQAQLDLSKADISAELDLLAQTKEVAAAEAEVEALEYSEKSCSHYSSAQRDTINSILSIDSKTRTKDYVETLTLNKVSHFVTTGHDETDESNNVYPRTRPPLEHSIHHEQNQSALNPYAQSYNPTVDQGKRPVLHPATHEPTLTTDFTRFLLKKDLLLYRLTNFNDNPESYQNWKASFSSIMADLNVTPREEMDLLEKWSGPESRKHIISLKASNYRFPERGLHRIWERLEERYGTPEMIEASLKKRLAAFPKLTPKDTKKLFELSDLVSEIESLKEDDQFKSVLGYFDSSTGVSPIVSKLPYNLQEKWTNSAVSYTKHHKVTYPPFSHFSQFLRDLSKVKNNPSFLYDQSSSSSSGTSGAKNQRDFQDKNPVSVRKTSTESVQGSADKRNFCFLHNVGTHTLNKCKTFLSTSIEDRKKFIRDKKICFRCVETTSHFSRDCNVRQPCSECGSSKHCKALHIQDFVSRQSTVRSAENGGESRSEATNTTSVNVNCTQICGSKFSGKSCAKIVLVDVFHMDQPETRVRLYAMIDDQSNMSLARSELFDQLKIQGKHKDYMLSSLSGISKTSGRDTRKIVVESVDRSVRLNIPILLECDQVPEIRDEIPTRAVAESYGHLHDIAKHIPPIDNTARISMLLGRDTISAHHVLDQRIGPQNTPYAQKLPLGWFIIGETCLGRTHIPDLTNVCKTNLLMDGRPSLFRPCPNEFAVRDTSSEQVYRSSNVKERDILGDKVFVRTNDDEKIGMSQDDRKFLDIMDEGLVKGSDGNWIAPLPFREPRPRLANNRMQAQKRARTLDASLRKSLEKQRHFVEFMSKIFNNNHAEVAPALKRDEECWYLPIFGVYHPRKPDQVRVVFDSSARHNGTSLNDVLMSGPDLANSLLGVLLRFRREPVAIVGDIQQMFYCFRVKEDHRNYLRFLWYKDNDLNNDLVEYRMCVHVFGNSPSPAIATLGLRKSVEGSDIDVSDFVTKDFYVDDGLTSLPTVDDAVQLMKKAQSALQKGGNLRLHKIASNKEAVMNSFPPEDLSKDILDLDLGSEPLPIQCSLGVNRSLETDSFLFQVSADPKPYTRRGVLSTVNGMFDPLGFIAPVVIRGKQFLRSLIHGTKDWDEPLPPEHRVEWERWRDSLHQLEQIRITRTYAQFSLKSSVATTVHIFCDALENAIAAAGYLQMQNDAERHNIAFVLGKAKVAPLHGHTIPRLELCAAVLAVEIAETISDHLRFPLENFRFHTDSKVVLGYINNTTRRFHTYVSNRVERITHRTKPEQWLFVPTDKNPADEGTRSMHAGSMQNSKWLSGPTHLLHQEEAHEHTFDLCDHDGDKEVRPHVLSLKTHLAVMPLGSHRFERFSHWRNLVNAIEPKAHRTFHCQQVKVWWVAYLSDCKKCCRSSRS